ncbi:hypothetical protein BGZ92_006978 [Podila epicladia]|nr:hypothetical protein BGZ92_006978 [Podila epicladia]
MKIPSMILVATVIRALWLVQSGGKGPSMGATTIVLAIAATLLATAAPALAALPTPVSAATARNYLASLTVEPERNDPPYDRKLFPHWIKVSGACDTRETVLKRDGTTVITNPDCVPTTGIWHSPYDDTRWVLPTDVDIDHVVPLKEAWVSGARLWTSKQREAFANALTRPQLVTVTDNVNQAKGDQDPSSWMPPHSSYHCVYLRAWVQVKYYYGLSIDPAEKTAISSKLKN